MRCYICDKQLSEKEVVLDDRTKKPEPCTECMDIIIDTAFPSGVELFENLLGDE